MSVNMEVPVNMTVGEYFGPLPVQEALIVRSTISHGAFILDKKFKEIWEAAQTRPVVLLQQDGENEISTLYLHKIYKPEYRVDFMQFTNDESLPDYLMAALIEHYYASSEDDYPVNVG